MNGVKISEHFAQRIRSTIIKVDRIPETAEVAKIPVRFEENPVIASGGQSSSIFIGAYNTGGGQWEKGTATLVHLHQIDDQNFIIPQYDGDGIPVLVSVLNIFVTIPPNYDRLRYCAYAQVGGVNVLLSAEC